MGQLLRITIGNNDYAFRIVNPESLNGATMEIEVEVDGRRLTLVRQDRSWVSSEPVNELESVAEAIGKAIALRYRI
jgi:hypothetical protein